MANPPGPDDEPALRDDDGTATELTASAESTQTDDASPAPERRFTAPSAFDAGKTQVINTVPEPETEVFAPLGNNADGGATERFASPGPVVPQVIPGRDDPGKRATTRRRSWGWVVAVVLVILAIVAVAIFGTVLLTRDPPAQSQRGGPLAAASVGAVTPPLGSGRLH